MVQTGNDHPSLRPADSDCPGTALAIVVSLAAIAIMTWFRMGLFPDRLTPVGFGIPLCLFLWLRDRRLLWLTTTAFAILSYVKIFIVLPRNVPTSQSMGDQWIAFAMQVGDLLVIAAVVHTLLMSREHLRSTTTTLQSNYDDLAAREEEIARQNEELQSQTEELERQSEELRFANEELTQRESTLSSMLDLSRSLTVELSKDEMYTRICETLAQMIHGLGTATAILEREGDYLHVRCHSGFGPQGMVEERLPTENAFADLVFAQLRTGYLEDLSLRPDVRVPQPKVGEQIVSVVATPLVVRGKAVGAIEVYSREKRSWTEQEIALIESLAAQTSISLENFELYEEVERERIRLRTVLETVPFTVAICSEDSSRVRLNPAGAALFNVAPNDDTTPIHGEGRWKFYREGEPLASDDHPLAQALCRNEPVESQELEVVFTSGKRVTILVSAAPIRDRGRRALGAVASAVDITAQKGLQRELDRRRREAEEASVRKTRFLAAASHDIRTPANAISLLAELMKRTADNPAMSHEIPGMADELQQSANSLVALVSNVLDVTRFESGTIELHESEFPLAPLIAEEIRQVQPLAQNKNLALKLDESAESIWLSTDRIKLGRVLGNLLGNAIKFCNAGQVSISTRKVEGGGVEISVSDTGVGIDKTSLERIFDEFYQLSDPQRSRGSGLGLTICKRLVDAMGGVIRVTSTPGQGSEFTVLFPAQRVLSGGERG